MPPRSQDPSPSNSPPISLPQRPASTVPLPPGNRTNNELIRTAVSAGREISGLLADSLRRSTLADNDESNLRQIVTLAEELRNHESPVEFTIGLVGDSGAGKSSLINSLLDEDNLAKTSGGGTACTTAVTEYRQNRATDTANYTAEVECMSSDEIRDLLRQSVVDYRRYHLQATDDSSEAEELQAKANVAWDIIKAAFADREECTEVQFQTQAVETDEIIQLVFGWIDGIAWPEGFNHHEAVFRSEQAHVLGEQIDTFLNRRLWPFVKVVRVFVGSAVLNNGVVLVDLPGFRDVNSARVRITERKLHECDEIFVVTEIGRAATNVGVQSLLQQLGQNFSGLRRSQGVAIICTKSEVQGPTQESEIIRDVPATNEFNANILANLQREIDEAEEDDQPTVYLKARRKHLIISARNQHVIRLLRTFYAHESRTRRVSVFCVSNNLYGMARRQRIQNEQLNSRPGNRRRSSNMAQRMLAMDQMLESSGISEVQDFCQSIPLASQIAETDHFLNTRVVTLLERSELWLTASVEGAGASRQAVPAFLSQVQEDLQHSFNTYVETSNEDLFTAKMDILQRPFTQNMNRWQLNALSGISELRGWSPQTLMAYWSHDGDFSTTAQRNRNWNADMLKTIVEDFEPSENEFQLRSEDLFQVLHTSVRERLTLLELQLIDLQGMNLFRQTFPRRRRNLDHEFHNITTSFCEELQMIFHDLLRTHGTSYIMRHMLPMYRIIESGPGTRVRLIAHLNRYVEGDRATPRLFGAIRDSFISAIDNLLEDTNTRLQMATEKCCEDIGSDLELLRGENSPTDERDGFIEEMFNTLEQARRDRNEAQKLFAARRHENSP